MNVKYERPYFEHVLRYYNKCESCITTVLRERIYSNLSVPSLLRDGDLRLCLVPGDLVLESLTSANILLMLTRDLLLFIIRELVHTPDYFPGSGLAMFENYGMGDLRTSACHLAVAHTRWVCIALPKAKEAELVLLNVSLRDGRPVLQLCEIYIAWTTSDLRLMQRKVRIIVLTRALVTWLQIIHSNKSNSTNENGRLRDVMFIMKHTSI